MNLWNHLNKNHCPSARAVQTSMTEFLNVAGMAVSQVLFVSRNSFGLMVHRKEKHSSAVKTCTYFLRGEYAFDDIECWFIHPKADHIQRNISHKSLKNLNVEFVKKFKRNRDFMEHRKKEHYNYISE